MGVSSIGSSGSYAGIGQQRPPQRPNDEISQGVDALKSAVESGDLTAIQDAYDSLTEAAESKGATSDSNNPLNNLLSSIGDALETGDVSAVQSAFETNGPGGQGGPQGAGGPPPGGPPPGGPPSGGPSEEAQSAIGDLLESLSSGDLESAQSSYSALADVLESDSENDPGANAFASSLSQFASALQSGNLSTAQDLFSSLIPRGGAVDTYA